MRAVVIVVASFASVATSADPRGDFEEAKTKWAALSVSTYSFTYLDRDDNIVPYPCIPYAIRLRVKSGIASKAVLLDGSRGCIKGGAVPESWLKSTPRSVTDLFSRISRFLDVTSYKVSLEATYDPATGIPLHMRAHKPEISDNDEGFDVRDVDLKR